MLPVKIVTIGILYVMKTKLIQYQLKIKNGLSMENIEKSIRKL